MLLVCNSWYVLWVVVFRGSQINGSRISGSHDTQAELKFLDQQTKQDLFSSQLPWPIINAWYNHYSPGLQQICSKRWMTIFRTVPNNIHSLCILTPIY